MTKLTANIKQLEEEIDKNRQAIYLQYEYTKIQLIDKLTTPPVFLIAFVTGGLLGKKLKRSAKKQRHSLKANTRTKLSLLQKIMALSSEISLAVNLYNRLKNMATQLTKKSERGITVTHQ